MSELTREQVEKELMQWVWLGTMENTRSIVESLNAKVLPAFDALRQRAEQAEREREEIRQAKNAMTIELYRKLDEKDEQLAAAQARVKELEENHCADCCCARSWKALDVQQYTGESIPEHIAKLKTTLAARDRTIARLREALKELRAIVKGECPSLLDEDSGGDANLDIKIDEALTAPSIPYPDWCRHKDQCAGKASCPEDPTCAD